MHSKFLSTLSLVVVLVGCSDDDSKDKTKSASPAHAADAGKVEDAGKGEVDAGGKQGPRDCDDPKTPGNDCDDAVGCREAIDCGLDAKSCCVPGFDVENVKCVSGLSCEAPAGRATCDGPEDCEGSACCVDINKGTTECSDSCEGKIGLCHKDENCPAGQTCKQGGSFTWWGICS